MSALKLESYAATLHFYLKEIAGNETWLAILTETVETIARRCDQSGPCVIGHIKGLALGTDKSFIRVSVISASRPAETDGLLKEPRRELEFTLNVIVYELTHDLLKNLVKETVLNLTSASIENVEVTTISQSPAHAKTDDNFFQMI